MMRLFRGLREPYDAARVGAEALTSTDFTDCPYTALHYARARKGVMLVVDMPDDSPKVSEELWLGTTARRLMVWGKFDAFIVAQIPAKELRAEVRRKGVAATDDEYKAMILRRHIGEWLRDARLSVRGAGMGGAAAVPSDNPSGSTRP